MLKFPLLRSTLEKPAALLLFGTLLFLGVLGTRAVAGDEGAGQAPAAVSDPAPAAEKPAPLNKAAEAVKPPVADAVPADTKPASSKPEAAAAGEKPAPAAGAASAPQGSSAPAKADAAPADTRPAGSKPGAVAGEKPAPTTGEASAPQEPSAPVKAEAKPADAKPASGTPKPAEPKEAGASKPKDLTPKLDTPAAAVIRPSTVNALYNIHFLGAHIGDFKIRSSINTRQYSLQANADIDFLFGTVSWKGVTSSYGLMTANGPAPQNYAFRYATSDKREAVEIRFQQRMVQDIIINPPSHPSARTVPITSSDLQNVVDPLSALVLLSQARASRLSSGDVCNKRLPIFDGKLRYDLVLSPKGTHSISGVGKLRGTAYVCRVTYVPIAGHKAGKADYASGNSGIEIWLVPMQEAGLLVPYYVQVPTPAGTASMVSARFDVETSAGRHALAD